MHGPLNVKPTGSLYNSLKTCLRFALVHTHISKRVLGIEFTTTNSFTKQKVRLKLQLNNKLVGRITLSKTQRMICLLCAVLKVMIYSL
jgi:hypothetical protein